LRLLFAVVIDSPHTFSRLSRLSSGQDPEWQGRYLTALPDSLYSVIKEHISASNPVPTYCRTRAAFSFVQDFVLEKTGTVWKQFGHAYAADLLAWQPWPAAPRQRSLVTGGERL